MQHALANVMKCIEKRVYLCYVGHHRLLHSCCRGVHEEPFAIFQRHYVPEQILGARYGSSVSGEIRIAVVGQLVLTYSLKMCSLRSLALLDPRPGRQPIQHLIVIWVDDLWRHVSPSSPVIVEDVWLRFRGYDCDIGALLHRLWQRMLWATFRLAHIAQHHLAITITVAPSTLSTMRTRDLVRGIIILLGTLSH